MKLVMWVFMLTCNLIIPVVMILFGQMFEKAPPKEPNWTFGYRTKRSMKSRDAWGFAQQYFGKLWQKMGRALLPLAVVGQALTLLCPDVQSMCNWSLVPTVAEAVVMTATLIPVERALKRNFDKDGNRL